MSSLGLDCLPGFLLPGAAHSLSQTALTSHTPFNILTLTLVLFLGMMEVVEEVEEKVGVVVEVVVEVVTSDG